MVTIVLLLLIFAGVFKGQMDAIADEELKSQDWHRKYDFTKDYNKHWWYFGLYEPTYPEKFPFSSTILVFLTDEWHKKQFLLQRCYYLAIGLLITDSLLLALFCSFVVFPLLVGIPFEAVYDFYRQYLRQRRK